MVLLGWAFDIVGSLGGRFSSDLSWEADDSLET